MVTLSDRNDYFMAGYSSLHHFHMIIWQVLQLGKLGTQGAFAEKVTPDIDGFTDEPVVWWDVRVAKNTFLDDSR